MFDVPTLLVAMYPASRGTSSYCRASKPGTSPALDAQMSNNNSLLRDHNKDSGFPRCAILSIIYLRMFPGLKGIDRGKVEDFRTWESSSFPEEFRSKRMCEIYRYALNTKSCKLGKNCARNSTISQNSLCLEGVLYRILGFAISMGEYRRRANVEEWVCREWRAGLLS